MGLPELVAEELDSEEFDKSLDELFSPYKKYENKPGIRYWVLYWFWKIRSFPF